MQCAGAHLPRWKDLNQPRAAPRGAAHCLLPTIQKPTLSNLLPRLRAAKLHERRVRCAAAAAPAPAGDPDPGAGVTQQAPSLASSGPHGSPSNNGTSPASTSPAPSSRGAAGGGRATGGGGGSPAEEEDISILNVSGRASFRSILRRSYMGEMLFVVVGSLICAATAHWTVGTPLRRFNPYSFLVLLPQATNVVPGTPVRMKGVAMGSVLSTTPLLDKVRVEVEVNEAKTIIPRGARFELTQSGMIPSANLDIATPEGVSAEVLAALVAARSASTAAAATSGGGGDVRGPLDTAAAVAAAAAGATGRSSSSSSSSSSSPSSPSSQHRPAASEVRLAGPKDVAACRLQGVLVCQGDQLDGLQGGSMDELMAHMLKTLRQGEAAAAAEGNWIVPGRGPVQG